MFEFFKDPILAPSTIGSMLMGISSALVGVLVYVRKRALVGETISHATYPGIVLAIALFHGVLTDRSGLFPLLVMVGAFFSGALGLYLIHYLEKKHSLNSDTALCFVLSTFLGFGVLLASRLQFTEPVWFQKVQAFLYGQAATMMQVHVYVYGSLVVLMMLFLFLFYHQLKVVQFDCDFAQLLGVRVKLLDYSTLVLIVLAIVIGIRSVGVILMAGMLIAPAAAARQFAKTLSGMFVAAVLFGMATGFLGVFLSVKGSFWLGERYGGKYALPTGPLILLVATCFVLAALVFSVKRGLIIRILRRNHFRIKCLEENILKYIHKKQKGVTGSDLLEVMRINVAVLWILSAFMKMKELLYYKEGKYFLTPLGEQRSKRIVRLHRLWEVYLFTCLDVQAENVHKSAEEMEHIITPELELALVKLLGDPKKDPHNQEIPE